MIVIDTSALVKVLVERSPSGDAVRARIRGETISAPAHLDAEVLSVLRGLAISGKLPLDRAQGALTLFGIMPVNREPLTAHLPRAWQLRANHSAYDALYIALAEAFECPLVTSDIRLSKSAVARCPIEVFG